MCRAEFSYQKLTQNMSLTHKYGIDNDTCIHTHKSWTFGIVLSGERKIQIADKCYTVKKNQYYLVPPNCPHKVLKGTAETETVVLSLEYPIEKADVDILTKNYSREYIIRKTKSIYGLSPSRLERQNRLRKAVKLLEKGYSETYIANETDFYDQSHLCRCFKSLWGITLRELNILSSEESC